MRCHCALSAGMHKNADPPEICCHRRRSLYEKGRKKSKNTSVSRVPLLSFLFYPTDFPVIWSIHGRSAPSQMQSRCPMAGCFPSGREAAPLLLHSWPRSAHSL